MHGDDICQVLVCPAGYVVSGFACVGLISSVNSCRWQIRFVFRESVCWMGKNTELAGRDLTIALRSHIYILTCITSLRNDNGN